MSTRFNEKPTSSKALSIADEAPWSEPEEEAEHYSFVQRRAVHVSKRPCLYLWTSLILAIGISFFAIIVGKFEVSLEDGGWESRGTQIADRHTQFLVTFLNRDELYNDTDGSVWDDMVNNLQDSRWVSEDDDENIYDNARRLQVQPVERRSFTLPSDFTRRLQSTNSDRLEGCDLEWYEEELLSETRLWPVWKVKDSSDTSLLGFNALSDLCLAEEKTQKVLEDNNLCLGCEEGCLPPFSLVLYTRMTLEGGMDMDCNELAQAWTEYATADLQSELVQCVSDMEEEDKPESCPPYFTSALVDAHFASSGTLSYTSSIFATKHKTDDIVKMYDLNGKFGKGSASTIEGKYDTQDQSFGEEFANASIGTDMILAMASGIITMVAIYIHTRSGLLTAVGIAQIVLSFPLAFFVYKFLGQLDFFPFLNFIGVFVVFALGADDVFVAVDKWKNARILHPTAPVSQIAAHALPDAADAMLLTTSTTAVAFFATALVPIAAIRCFSVFVGLLIILDYFMCILLVFPALVIYDNRNATRDPNSKGCCSCCRRDVEANVDENGEEKPSLIRRILTGYYNFLHTCRYPLLVAVVGAFAVSAIFASRMELPESSEVRVLPSDNEFEMTFKWRQNLLYDLLDRKAGSAAFVVWGLTPADTGNHNNPESFTALRLDDSFEPSKTEAQLYLRDFCDRLYAEDFATPLENFEECSMNLFDTWLSEQAVSAEPDAIWTEYCAGADSIPVPEENFDACIHHWNQQYGDSHILTREGKVEIMYIRYNSRVRFDSPYGDLDKEWHLIEDWMEADARDNAPASADGMYFTSEDYWWYDTNGRLLSSAYVAAVIAVITASLVILLSSRSIVLTLFSAFTISYVLASVTALMVSFGWTLGFLEAICFAILIGLSCDFVIHFSHAYAALKGDYSRNERTQHALIQMGPSILAAGVTSIIAATVMLFTIITFFVKFGIILFVTIAQATVGGFVVFLVLTDSCGPKNPTYTADLLMEKVFKRKKQSDEASSGRTDSQADMEAVAF